MESWEDLLEWCTRMVLLESGEALRLAFDFELINRFISSYGAAVDAVELAKQYRDQTPSSSSGESGHRAKL